MKTLPDIKKDLEFNKGLGSLIEVLKNIAVAQFRVMEQKVKIYEKFTSTIDSFFELIDPEKVPHAFLRSSERPQAVVAVTSDGGLLGGLNMQVVNSALLELEKKPGRLIVVGERGKMYARESKVPFVAFAGIHDEDRYMQAMQVRDYLFNKIKEGALGDLSVVYPYPVSFTVQRVDAVRFLPFVPIAKPQTISKDGTFDVILESGIGDIIEYLLYLWMGQKLYEIFGLSRLAEFAARYMHLEESLQKLKEMDNKLKLQYFRVRHELIDRNMRELFSARLLYAGH